MKLSRIALVALLFTIPAFAEEATFDRTLKVTGPVDLEVVTGSGHIYVRSGAAGTITVHGIVKESCCNIFSNSDPNAIKSIVDNPPIEQSGNTVRIGHLGESQRYNNISVSYELVVPSDTKLLSKTGSGAQEISGIAGSAEVQSGSGGLKIGDIGGAVRAKTGSGSIMLSNIGGSVTAHTGSGSIRGDGLSSSSSPARAGVADNGFAASSAGYFDFQTGSGSIRISGLRGAVRAHTGSGHIELDGQPTGDWRLNTGSGGITLRLPAQAAFELNAHTSSGSIHTNRQLTIQGTTGRHDLRGTVNGGGGIRLDLSAGSGSIEID